MPSARRFPPPWDIEEEAERDPHPRGKLDQ
jgi:hypothetical protein